jgi:very-short-patch-repair endonuclease
VPSAQQPAPFPRTVLSHESAAALWKLPLLRPASSEHVTVARNHSRSALAPGRTVHRADLTDADVARVRGTTVTTALRTVLDCARTLPFREGLAIADAALHRRLITRGALERAARTARGTGARMIRAVAHHSDGRAQSMPESFLRALLLTMDVGRITLQLRLDRDSHPHDLGLSDVEILLECDSSHHTVAVQITRDSQDITDAGVRGWVILRFSYAQIVHTPWDVEAAILTVVARQRLRLPVTRGLPEPADHGWRSPVRA